MLDRSKIDAIVDAVGKLSSRFDAMSVKDEWSPEAREAAAKARGGKRAPAPASLSEKIEQKNYERDLRPEHEKARAYGRKS